MGPVKTALVAANDQSIRMAQTMDPSVRDFAAADAVLRDTGLPADDYRMLLARSFLLSRVEGRTEVLQTLFAALTSPG